MRSDIDDARKRRHRMKCAEAESIGHCPDIQYPFGTMWLSFDYIIFTHTIEGQ
jgi:hypothetical protein